MKSELEKAIEIITNLPSYKEAQKVAASELKPLLCVLREVTEYAARNTCLHDNTHRGGAIWEICDDCGAKWSDDRNPKPEDAHELPKEIQDAYDALARYDA